MTTTRQTIMNEQLVEVANSAIAQCRVEQLDDEDTLHMAIGACTRYAREQGVIGDELTAEMRAAFEQVVRQAMKEEPAMIRCPFCGGQHQASQVEDCPLNPHSNT